MIKLNFPEYQFRIKQDQEKWSIFDIIRKKFVALTPEEWVRQHLVHFLISEKKISANLISVETTIQVENLTKRCDVLVYNTLGEIVLTCECKSPYVKISQEVFDQIARYNMTLHSPFLCVTNGLEHFWCQINAEEKKYLFLRDFPSF